MGLLDQFGRPVDTTKLTEEESAPTVMGIRHIMSMHPSRGLTPQRLAQLLIEAEEGDPIRYLELAEDMEEKDLHYSAVLATRKNGVAQLDLSMVAASDDAHDVEISDAFNEFLNRDTVQDELFDVLDAIGKGYSVSEIIWEHSAKQWMPARIEHRDPRWFGFDRIGGRTLLLRDYGATATDPLNPGLTPLTPFKYIAHLHKSKSGLPIRAGLARLAAWIYLFKNYALKDWVAFGEVFGQPYRVGKYHSSATTADKQMLLKAVASIGSDAAAIIPDSMVLEFVEASRSSSVDLYERMCRFFDEQLSKGVLGQTTTTEVTQGGGSRALGEVHDRVKAHIQKSDARQLTATLNAQLVRPFVDLNFGPQDRYPRLMIGLPDELSTSAKIDAVAALVPQGLKVGQRQVRSWLGIKEPDKDEELLAPSGDPPGRPPFPPVPASQSRKSKHATQQHQDAIDQLVQSVVGDDSTWVPLVDSMIGPIRELLSDATTIDEVRSRLAELIADMDPSAVAQMLANDGFAAAIAGHLEIPPVADPGAALQSRLDVRELARSVAAASESTTDAMRELASAVGRESGRPIAITVAPPNVTVNASIDANTPGETSVTADVDDDGRTIYHVKRS